MSEASKPQPETIRAAGGLLWRWAPDGNGREIAVVRRDRHGGDWALPKGHLERGESWIAAALREVREETGYRGRIEGFVGAVAYDVSGQPKLVRFWAMTTDQDNPRNLDRSEVKEVAWLSSAAAVARLSYPLERILVENWLVAEGPKIQRSRQSWFGSDASLDRLENMLHVHGPDLDTLIDRYASGVGTSAPSHWIESARRYMSGANKALRQGKTELGWRYFNAATHEELTAWSVLDRGVFLKRVGTILREADAKLGDSWRKKTIVDALRAPDGAVREDVSADTAIFAARILDEHFDNVYRKLHLLQDRLVVLSIVGVVLVILWIAVAPASIISGSGEFSNSPNLFYGLVVLLGVMGAVISGFLTTRDTSRTSIPDQLQTTQFSIARLVMGSVSALAVSAFLGAGIINLGPNTSALALALAFVAGFSEQLLPKAVGAVVDRVDKK